MLRELIDQPTLAAVSAFQSVTTTFETEDRNKYQDAQNPERLERQIEIAERGENCHL